MQSGGPPCLSGSFFNSSSIAVYLCANFSALAGASGTVGSFSARCLKEGTELRKRSIHWISTGVALRGLSEGKRYGIVQAR
uniref:Uncharacterized protein n=1 Tax=Arundo donax TaxID=35708 RepID=A0A0A9DBS3_ARUDO